MRRIKRTARAPLRYSVAGDNYDERCAIIITPRRAGPPYGLPAQVNAEGLGCAPMAGQFWSPIDSLPPGVDLYHFSQAARTR